MSNNEFVNFSRKKMKVDYQKELVTLRAIPAHKKIQVWVSLGNIINDLVGFKDRTRVMLKFHPKKRNIILISKQTIYEHNGYLLTAHNSPNCLRFAFTLQSWHDLKLSQTVICDYEIHSEGNLLIDFSSLKWSK